MSNRDRHNIPAGGRHISPALAGIYRMVCTVYEGMQIFKPRVKITENITTSSLSVIKGKKIKNFIFNTYIYKYILKYVLHIFFKNYLFLEKIMLFVSF